MTTTTNHTNNKQAIPHLDPQKGRQSSSPGTIQWLLRDSGHATSSRSSIFNTLRLGTSSTSTFSSGNSTRNSRNQENGSSQGTVAILNRMYGRTSKLQPGNVSTLLSEESPGHSHIQPDASTSKLEFSHDSEESISPSQNPLKKVPSGPRNWIPSTAMSITSGRSSSNLSTSTGSGSRDIYVGNSSLPAESQDSASNSTSKSSVRIVGRGGSGSRVRLAETSTSTLSSSNLRSGGPPVVRPAGRGGLGSRPKPLDPVVEPSPQDVPRPSVAADSTSEPQKFMRPRGRGGAGARLKPASDASDSPGILQILSKRKSKLSRSLKGKGKERAVQPIPPSLSYGITNTSLSTLSTIHFEGETGSPGAPFLPQGSSSTSVTNGDEVSVSPDSTSISLSTFENTASTSKTTLDSLELDDDSDSERLRPSTPTAQRKKSRSKLERTLGYVPPEMQISPKNLSSPPKDKLPKLLIDPTPPTKDKTAKVFKRSSLSVTSLGSLFSRSSEKSHNPPSTLTDDLHQFGLEDDLSESWGDLNRNSMYSSVSISGSPIVFSPPSPIVVKQRPASPDTPIATEVRPLPVPPPPVSPKLDVAPQTQKTENDDQHIVAPSPTTIGRSLSYTTQRRSVRGTHTASASLHTDIRLDNNGVALRSNWVIPPGREDREVTFITRDLPERPQAWTGEWNSDLTNVIKSLRTLR